MQIDDDGVADIIAATVRRAERDARKGDTDAGDFLAWIRGKQAELDEAAARIDARLDALNGNGKTPAKAKPEPEPAYVPTDDDLVQLGLDPRKHRRTPAELAHAERLDQARATLAALGLNPKRYSEEQLLSMEEQYNA